MKAVFDTNVYVSAFLVPGSQGDEAFRLACRKRFTLYSSVPILTETAHVLRTKFHQSEDDIRDALKLISRTTMILQPLEKVTVLRDLADNRILECALAAQADLVVSGDHHLLELRKFHDIVVVRLSDFLRMFPQEDS